MWLYQCSRRDSNSYHQNRNLTFYPLNYGNGFLLQIYYLESIVWGTINITLIKPDSVSPGLRIIH